MNAELGFGRGKRSPTMWMLPQFIAAVLVQGDVNYCPHDGAVGNVWEFFAGRAWWQAATDAWKILLATGDAVLRSLGLRGR
jgi:hypothetical protein